MANPKSYIVIHGDTIVRVLHSSKGEEGVVQSIGGEKHDKIIQVPYVKALLIRKGHSVKMYDTEWSIRKLSDLVLEKLVPVPKDHKLDGERFTPMTLQEKHEAGTIQIPPRCKVLDNSIVPMTEEEIILSGQATQKQLDDERKAIEEEILIQEEIRKIAIERLTASGKLSK